MTTLPADYRERVYAGVLGKMIGVYLGRPIENWSYERISAQFGEITGYVHEQAGRPLIVADDDLSGTFRFLRAIEDVERLDDLTAEAIGQTWRNLLIEDRTILWWGGLGTSTEHTAFERLKQGIPAPLSGAIATNGRTVAEQIGAQIFIDGWAMLCPGDPGRAIHLAQLAASVSHDGEAIYGAQVIAALEAAAFVESNLDRLLDTARRLIPAGCTIGRLMDDIRNWHAAAPTDWRAARQRIVAQYGYDQFPGHCHIVPNHALILLGLLYGAGSFSDSMRIVCTSGWDTDCNAGNLGCLLGIRNGLTQFDTQPSGTNWLTPLADRLYLTSSDGGSVITDALREAEAIAGHAVRLSGGAVSPPKDGARFHFSLPHAVQGFQTRPSGPNRLELRNVPLPGTASRALALYCTFAKPGVLHALTPTFIQPEHATTPGYLLLASPTLYPGQEIRAHVLADSANAAPARVRLCAAYDAGEGSRPLLYGEPSLIPAGGSVTLAWTLPPEAFPALSAGLAVEADAPGETVLCLDWLTWDGAPDVVLAGPDGPPAVWQQAWVSAAGQFSALGKFPLALRHAHNDGLALCGVREWTDCTVEAEIASTLMRGGGLAVRVQGLRRYVAVLLDQGGLLRAVEQWDGDSRVLAEHPFDWQLDTRYRLTVTVQADTLRVAIDGQPMLTTIIARPALSHGAIAMVVNEGSLLAVSVRIAPASQDTTSWPI